MSSGLYHFYTSPTGGEHHKHAFHTNTNSSNTVLTVHPDTNELLMVNRIKSAAPPVQQPAAEMKTLPNNVSSLTSFSLNGGLGSSNSAIGTTTTTTASAPQSTTTASSSVSGALPVAISEVVNETHPLLDAEAQQVQHFVQSAPLPLSAMHVVDQWRIAQYHVGNAKHVQQSAASAAASHLLPHNDSSKHPERLTEFNRQLSAEHLPFRVRMVLVCDWMHQLLDLVEALHINNVTCWNIRPKNILIDSDGRITIANILHRDNISVNYNNSSSDSANEMELRHKWHKKFDLLCCGMIFAQLCCATRFEKEAAVFKHAGVSAIEWLRLTVAEKEQRDAKARQRKERQQQRELAMYSGDAVPESDESINSDDDCDDDDSEQQQQQQPLQFQLEVGRARASFEKLLDKMAEHATTGAIAALSQLRSFFDACASTDPDRIQRTVTELRGLLPHLSLRPVAANISNAATTNREVVLGSGNVGFSVCQDEGSECAPTTVDYRAAAGVANLADWSAVCDDSDTTVAAITSAGSRLTAANLAALNNDSQAQGKNVKNDDNDDARTEAMNSGRHSIAPTVVVAHGVHDRDDVVSSVAFSAETSSRSGFSYTHRTQVDFAMLESMMDSNMNDAWKNMEQALKQQLRLPLEVDFAELSEEVDGGDGWDYTAIVAENPAEQQRTSSSLDDLQQRPAAPGQSMAVEMKSHQQEALVDPELAQFAGMKWHHGPQLQAPKSLV